MHLTSELISASLSDYTFSFVCISALVVGKCLLSNLSWQPVARKVNFKNKHNLLSAETSGLALIQG